MTFLQTHYTSRQAGLSGHSGFQFCAITPGISPETSREIEKLTVYQQPRYFQKAGESTPLEDYPVNLIHAFSAASGLTIIARVTFIGLDFSNRSGNYFAHSIITKDPSGDLQAVLPAELWDAPFWVSQLGDAPELPGIDGPLPVGPLARSKVSEFLANRREGQQFIADLLIACDQAIQDGPRVLLIGTDSAEVSRWVAAVSYLLAPAVARKLTFSTYCHDPLRCPTHIVGTVPAAGPFRRESVSGFRCFGPDRKMPDMPPSRAASFLARMGIERSAGLWKLAASLGQPAPQWLGQAFPYLVSAALISGHELEPDELNTAIDFLSARPINDADHVAPAVQSALNYGFSDVSVEGQQELVRLAKRADSALGDQEATLATAAEREVVLTALREIETGHDRRNGFPLHTAGAQALATRECSRILRTREVAVALPLLAWALAAGTQPTDDVLISVGQRLQAALPEANVTAPGPSTELTRAVAQWPKLRQGMIRGLAAQDAAQQQAALAHPAFGAFSQKDFATQPALTEKWLIASVRGGRVSAVTCFKQIASMRRVMSHGRAVDEELIESLWPSRDWTWIEATELLRSLEPGDLANELVTNRLMRLAQTAPRENELTAWTRFVRALDHRLKSEAWPEKETRLAAELAKTSNLVETLFQPWSAHTDQAINELIFNYEQGSDATRPFLDCHLSAFVLFHSNPSRLLAGCSDELFTNFCRYARSRIAGYPPERIAPVAARVFVVVQDLRDIQQHTRASQLEHEALLPTVPGWNRSEISAMANEADMLLRHGGKMVNNWHSRQSRQSRLTWWRNS